MTDLARHSEKLHYFFQVTLTGSLQSAGRKIGVSAPSLSHAIKELEGVLKTTLFDRSSKGMKLSPDGIKLQKFCERYFSDMEALTKELRFPASKLKQKIKIGIFPSIAIYFWPKVLEHFGDDSDYVISLQTNRSRQILESLIHREIDIAVTVDTVKYDRMVKHELYQDRYACYISNKKMIQRTGKQANSQSAYENEIIMFMPDAQDENGKTLKQFVDSQAVPFKDHYELDSFEVISEFIQRGYGIGILPTKVAQNHTSQLKKIKALKDVPTDFGLHRFYLTHRNDLDLPQKFIEKLLVAARKAVKQMNEA